jgi:hypothetical protein
MRKTPLRHNSCQVCSNIWKANNIKLNRIAKIYIVLGKDKYYFVNKKNTAINQNIRWIWHRQNDRVYLLTTYI